MLSTTRDEDGTAVTNAYPSADNAGMGWLQIFDAMEAGMTSDELTDSTRAALVGLSVGLRLAHNRNLNGFPMDSAIRNYRMK